MNSTPAQITLDQWQMHYRRLHADGLKERSYGGPLARHAEAGDVRLRRLRFDNSPAALALWNLVLTEEDRLTSFRQQGGKLIGTMKDLGTVPILVYAFDRMAAFYPDAAWWIPCFKQQRDGLFDLADRVGQDAAFCPVRAMVGAFINGRHFPIPDALVSSAGSVCDDFSVTAHRLETLGHPIFWWEMPHRRTPEHEEQAIRLPNGLSVPKRQVDVVREELVRIAGFLEGIADQSLCPKRLTETIQQANRIRSLLRNLRDLVFSSPCCPLGALETLLAEMLALHFCSDPTEARIVLDGLLDEVRRRVAATSGLLSRDAVRVFWINPPADLYAMTLLEQCGGRLCGTDFMLSHALTELDDAEEPFTALAKAAMSDPMTGSATQRAERIAAECRQYNIEAVVVCRIPGASHCAAEGRIIGHFLNHHLDLPVLEIEIPSLIEPYEASLTTRLEALIETARNRRHE